MTVLDTKIKAGRRYKVDMNGAKDLRLTYQVLLDAPLGANEAPVSFAGVPAIGTPHPDRPGYYALSYDVEQPEGAAKHTLNVTVNYGPADIVTNAGEDHAIEEVLEWGWNDGTGEKELTMTADAEDPLPVVNSAGDPFDSVPSVSVPMPVFTKVIRRSKRYTGYPAVNCRVNRTAVTIGAMQCAPATLLCTVAEKLLIGEEKLPYEYTIHLKYRSNVTYEGLGDAQTEIGWNVAVADTGMREIDLVTGEKKLIEVISKETGQPASVTSSALLDGDGHALVTTQEMSHPKPYMLIFTAYPAVEFPQWLYSEPPIPTRS